MRIATLLLLAWAAGATAAELKPGQASGTFMYDGTTVAIEHAATYVDQADARKPLVLILSPGAVEVAGWKDGSDFLKYRMQHPFLGVAFWLDEKRNVLRSAFFDAEGLPQGKDVGLFELQLDAGDPALLKGTARSTDAAASLKKIVRLDAAFAAAVNP